MMIIIYRYLASVLGDLNHPITARRPGLWSNNAAARRGRAAKRAAGCLGEIAEQFPNVSQFKATS